MFQPNIVSFCAKSPHQFRKTCVLRRVSKRPPIAEILKFTCFTKLIVIHKIYVFYIFDCVFNVFFRELSCFHASYCLFHSLNASCKQSELYSQPATYKLSIRCLEYGQLLLLIRVNIKIFLKGWDDPSLASVLKNRGFCFGELFKSRNFL